LNDQVLKETICECAMTAGANEAPEQIIFLNQQQMGRTGPSRTVRKWYHAGEILPGHDQQVLLKCDDGYHVAVYNELKKGFLLRGGAFLTQENCEMHWMPIVFP
jgi:hypothetical protein